MVYEGSGGGPGSGDLLAYQPGTTTQGMEQQREMKLYGIYEEVKENKGGDSI